MKTTTSPALAALFLLACGAGNAGEPATLVPANHAPSASASAAASASPDPAKPAVAATPLGDRLPLLGDRLRIKAPDGAKVAPRGHSIMAADASNEEETRVVLVPGSGDLAKFVLLARESFVYGSGDVAADTKKLLGKEADELRLEKTKVGAGLSAVALEPKKELASHGALFVYGAVIERADKTLCELSFYILSDMQAERADWAARARTILASVEAGSGGLPGAKRHQLDTGEGHVLVLDLPRQAVLTKQEGPDFLVYHLRELGPIGQSMPTVGIYIGGHPSHQFEQSGIAASKVKKRSGPLLGKTTNWYSWTAEGGDGVSEAIAPVGKYLRVHAFVSGPAAVHAELERALGAMKLK